MKWGELITLEYGKPVPDKACVNGAVPVYGTNGKIGTSNLPPLCGHPSFILGRKGAYRGVHYSDVPFSVIDTAFYAEPVSDKLDLKWAYYKFLTYDINRMDSGSAIPSTDRYEIYNIPVELPPLETQKKTVRLLDSIEAKIRCNQQINENLQQQVKTLFTEMFPSVGNAEMANGILSDIAHITMGQSPNGKSYNEAGIGTVFFQGRAEFGFRFPVIRLFTTEPKRMATRGDTLMSVRAPVGDLNVAHENCCIGRGLSAIHSKYGHSSFILYTMFSLRTQLDIFNAQGTVFGSINKDALNEMPVFIPETPEIERFENIAAPIDRMILKNHDEIVCLTALRDALLTRLMSGELDVSALNL